METKYTEHVCDHCNRPAVITVDQDLTDLPPRHASLCMEHTPKPVAGDTLESMYDRYFDGLDALVCAVSLCGRDGDEMWHDRPMCTEHHEMHVEMAIEREDEGET